MSIKETVEGFAKALRAGDASAFPPLFAPNATWQVASVEYTGVALGTPPPFAKDLFGEVQKFVHSFKTFTYEPYNTIISEADGKAVIEARARGDSKVEGVPAYVNEVITSFEFEGTKIKALREYLANGGAAGEVARRAFA